MQRARIKIGAVSKESKQTRYQILKMEREQRMKTIAAMKFDEGETIKVHVTEYTDELIEILLTFSYKDLKTLYEDGKI